MSWWQILLVVGGVGSLLNAINYYKQATEMHFEAQRMMANSRQLDAEASQRLDDAIEQRAQAEKLWYESEKALAHAQALYHERIPE